MELGLDAILVNVFLELKLSESILGFMMLGLDAILELIPVDVDPFLVGLGK